jgi:predicted AlkP superfamily phosphohydrolase/phosphomutase/Flp pilus assembly protein TadD
MSVFSRFAGLVLLLSVLLTGCGPDPEPGRVLVLGLDGADPNAVDLLMSEGKLPNFAKLRQEGAYGRLLSAKPLLSPVVWTTIATGKRPDQHRIGHFVAINQATGEQLPVTSQMRKVKALWSILSDAGKQAAVVGWWATWPAETINGAIVSDHLCYHFLFEEGFTGAGEKEGLTHPPELANALAPMIRRPGDLTLQDTAPFINVTEQDFARPFDFTDDLSHFKWALATADTYRSVSLHLWNELRPDLLMTYVEATDSTAHLFGHLFRAEGLSGELAEQQKRYGGAVERMYVHADGIIGDFIGAMDDRTTLVVVSDHGFRLGVLQDDPSKTRDMRRVSEKFHTPHGIIYLYGNRVKPHSRLQDPTILDVAPTVLALAGLAPARDMPGRILSEVLDLAVPAPVPSYESGPPSPATQVAGDSAVDPEILEKLRSLGYLDTASPTGDRNVAAVLFEQGRYEEAAKAYEKLVAADPDDGAARASLAGALGALGRYDEALVQLAEAIRIEPLNPEAYHNRGVIFERKEDKDAAIREYRTALRYSPQYEPSRQALLRLGATDTPSAPATEDERRAYALAEQASLAARRGDYTEAMRMLDEAERIAPRYALVQQYRSNVAYLMGDRESAIAALKKGLELEPDNALFRQNLENLKNLQETSPR